MIMKFELDNYHRNISDEILIEDLKAVADKLHKDTVTSTEYTAYGKFNAKTHMDRFGSWFNALERAGLKPVRAKTNIPEEELFKNIEEVWIKLGRQPKFDEFQKPLSKYSIRVYINRFGGWRDALEKFVFYINTDKDEEENKNNSIEETTPVDNVSGEFFRHKTKREISDRLRFRILMRDGFTCKKCGRSPIKERDVELHVDHIIPWSKDGETLPENLETKCSRCNLGKGNAFNE